MRIFFALALATAVGVVAGTAVSGCSDDEPTPTPTDASTSMQESDIVAVMAALNRGEIDAGNLAKDRASRADVKAYANMMVSDHTTALNRQQSLATQLGITPTENTVSGQVKTDAQTELQKLQSMMGSAFDDAYVASQVKMHEKALQLIDGMLLPAMPRAELVNELKTARASVAAHLAEAKALQGGSDAGMDGGMDSDVPTDAATDTKTDGAGGDAKTDASTDAKSDGAGDAVLDVSLDALGDGG